MAHITRLDIFHYGLFVSFIYRFLLIDIFNCLFCIRFFLNVLISRIGFLYRYFAFHMKGNLGSVSSPALLLNKSRKGLVLG